MSSSNYSGILADPHFHLSFAMSPARLPPLPIAPAAWDSLADRVGLSGRQRAITELILRGQSDQEMAVALQIAKPTLRTHISRLFAKLGVSDRESLILLFFRMSHDAPSPVITSDDDTNDDWAPLAEKVTCQNHYPRRPIS